MAAGVIATNKKAYHNYHLGEKWECGIALKGGEVKSVRQGGVSFKDSFARLEPGGVFLYNLHINPYAQASYLNEEADRPRQLLLHQKEIKKIAACIREKGQVLVPTRIYFNSRGFVKVELSSGKGKKLYDKREDIKKRTIDRALKRVLRVRKG